MKGSAWGSEKAINLAFFQSDAPASFGCFVIGVTDSSGGTGHTLALVRTDQENNDSNYIVDSNPLYGRTAHPFTTKALTKLQVVEIHYAVKIICLKTD